MIQVMPNTSREAAAGQNSRKRDSNKIGLIAGWGEFPVHVARELKQQGFEVYCVGILDHADPILAEICDDYRVFGMGRMGAHVKYFRRRGVERATMAGKIFKTVLYQRAQWLRHLPDLTFWRHFYPNFITRTADCRDDTLLLTVTRLFAAGGVDFASATDFAPDLLVNKGTLGRLKPTASQQKDIDFGFQIAREMGRLDIGQSVVIKNQTVVAVEAIEGTDECIRRVSGLCGDGGFTVVKVAKPNQDMRFDVPTVGVGTIKSIHAAGGSVLAIEAGKTILLDEASTIETADRLGVVVVAV
jgi:DUF1009 family protein